MPSAWQCGHSPFDPLTNFSHLFKLSPLLCSSLWSALSRASLLGTSWCPLHRVFLHYGEDLSQCLCPSQNIHTPEQRPGLTRLRFLCEVVPGLTSLRFLCEVVPVFSKRYRMHKARPWPSGKGERSRQRNCFSGFLRWRRQAREAGSGSKLSSDLPWS